MFDDVLLTGQSTAKRWSVPVSFTVELAAIGLLLLLPLIYGERLPALPNVKALVYLPPAQKAIVQPAAQTHHASTPVFNAHRIVTPAWIPPHPALIVDEAPSIPNSELLASGPAGGRTPAIGITDLLPRRDMPPPPGPPVVVTPAPPQRPMRVSEGVQAAKRRVFVMPAYPALAKQARISGAVELVGVIGTDGRIQSLRVISGHFLLVKAAVDAVKQWRYEPTLLNGQPVEVIAPITVTFTLQ